MAITERVMHNNASNGLYGEARCGLLNISDHSACYGKRGFQHVFALNFFFLSPRLCEVPYTSEELLNQDMAAKIAQIMEKAFLHQPKRGEMIKKTQSEYELASTR